MIKLPKKSLVLFAVAFACSAFASSASAANWQSTGVHTLTSFSLGFNSAALGGGADCSHVIFESAVSAGGTLTINSATFNGCVGTGNQSGCPVTSQATGVPWEVTALSTTDIIINNIVVDNVFDGACGGTPVRWTGSLTATWNNATHSAAFINAAFTLDLIGMQIPATLNGTVRDVQNTLTIA